MAGDSGLKLMSNRSISAYASVPIRNLNWIFTSCETRANGLLTFNTTVEKHHHRPTTRESSSRKPSPLGTERWQTSIATAQAGTMVEDEATTRESEVVVSFHFTHLSLTARARITNMADLQRMTTSANSRIGTNTIAAILHQDRD